MTARWDVVEQAAFVRGELEGLAEAFF